MSLKRSSGIASPIAVGLGSAARSGTNPARKKATMVTQSAIGTLNSPGGGALSVRTIVVMVTACTAAVQPREFWVIQFVGGTEFFANAEARATATPLPSLARGGKPGAVNHIHHLPQAADVFSVELENQSRELGQMRIVRLEGQRARADDLSRFDNVVKFGIQPREKLVSRISIEANDELAANESHAVVDAVKPQDFSDCPFHGIETAKQGHVGGRNQLPVEELLANKFLPLAPVGSSRFVDANDGHQIAFAGLNEGQCLEAFVERAEPAGKEHDRMHFFDEQELARKEVLEVDELLVLGNDRIGVLLEGEHDVQSERHLAAGAGVPGLHDASAAAGDDHPAAGRHLAVEFLAHFVDSPIRRGPRRTKHRYFSDEAKGLEDLEGVPQLLERPKNDFQVAARGLIGDQLVGDLFDLIDEDLRPERFKLDGLRRREHVGFGKVGPRVRHMISHES